MISHGLPIYVALEPVDMRMGYEGLGGLVRERMRAEPRSKALFVFVGKRGHTMKVLTWDGTGAIIVHKKLTQSRVRQRAVIQIHRVLGRHHPPTPRHALASSALPAAALVGRLAEA